MEQPRHRVNVVARRNHGEPGLALRRTPFSSVRATRLRRAHRDRLGATTDTASSRSGGGGNRARSARRVNRRGADEKKDRNSPGGIVLEPRGTCARARARIRDWKTWVNEFT